MSLLSTVRSVGLNATVFRDVDEESGLELTKLSFDIVKAAHI